MLTLAFLNPVVTLGGATTQTATASMFAFTGATTAGGLGAPQVSVDGGAGQAVGTHVITSATPTFQTTTPADTNPRFRVQNTDFTLHIGVIPEPSYALILGLCGIGILVAQRKRRRIILVQ